MTGEFREYLKPGKKNFILIYLTYLAGMMTQALGIIAVFLALVGAYYSYTNMNIKNQFLRSHYIFAFRTFCICLISWVLSSSEILSWIFLGIIVKFVIFILVVLRCIIALQYLMENSEHPNPLTFWIK